VLALQGAERLGDEGACEPFDVFLSAHGGS
jgi:hypothetical protein